MKRFVAIVAAVALCALGVLCLSACGGSGSDEEQILEVIGTDMPTGAELASEFREDAEFVENAELMGLDIDVFSEGIAKHFVIDTQDLEINGKKASANVYVTLPAFDAMYELLDKRANEFAESNDISGYTEDDVYKLYGRLLTYLPDDPDFPTQTEVFPLTFSKSLRGWSMDNADDLEAEMNKVFLGE